jgi:hypothetical protein
VTLALPSRPQGNDTTSLRVSFLASEDGESVNIIIDSNAFLRMWQLGSWWEDTALVSEN